MNILSINQKEIAKSTGYVTVHYGKHVDFAYVVGGNIPIEDSIAKYPSFSTPYKLSEIENADELLEELDEEYYVSISPANIGIEEVNGRYKFNL